jgi:hypothetical protein
MKAAADTAGRLIMVIMTGIIATVILITSAGGARIW